MKTAIVTLMALITYLLWCAFIQKWMDKRSSQRLADSFDRARGDK